VIQPCAGRMRSRAVHFRTPVGAFHVHLFHACLSRDWCRADRDAAPLRRRRGLEDGGTCLVRDFLFWIGPALLLPRNHCDLGTHARLGDGMGQNSGAPRLAAFISGLSDVRPFTVTAAVVHERSRVVAAHRRHRWSGSRRSLPTSRRRSYVETFARRRALATAASSTSTISRNSLDNWLDNLSQNMSARL
jgi:hypothetical protein